MGLCERFSSLPSELENEDASLLGMVQLVDMVRSRRMEVSEGGQ